MFVQIHKLTAYSSNRLNTDGEGRPKIYIWGGVPRPRQSSQSIKSHAREKLVEFGLPEDGKVHHTRMHTPRAIDALVGDDTDKEIRRQATRVADAVNKALLGHGSKELSDDTGPSNDAKTVTLIAGEQAFGLFTDICDEYYDDIVEFLARIDAEAANGNTSARKKAYKLPKDVTKNFFRETWTTGMALTGRTHMNDKYSNVASSVVVSGAEGIGKIHLYKDFFTSVETASDNGVRETNMLSAKGEERILNANTFYSVSTIDVRQLQHNLREYGHSDLTDTLIRAWIKSYIHYGRPRGGMNDTHADNPPSTIAITVSPTLLGNLSHFYHQTIDENQLVDGGERMLNRLTGVLNFSAPPSARAFFATQENLKTEPHHQLHKTTHIDDTVDEAMTAYANMTT